MPDHYSNKPFTPVHCKYFNAEAGAYSEVTPTEYGDSQITLDDEEKRIALGHFGKQNIHVGNVSSNPEAAEKEFRLHGTNDGEAEVVNLNLVFPKPGDNELRLYLSQREGFKPEAGDIWFLYTAEDNGLYIGSTSKEEWRVIESKGVDTAFKDNDSSEYQSEAEKSAAAQTGSSGVEGVDTQVEATESTSTSYTRDPDVAAERFERSGYECELTGETSFISARTGKPYVEAHHLIPVSYQDQFGPGLDTVENVFALSPEAHCAVHYGTPEKRREIIDALIEIRPGLLGMYDVTREDLYDIYNCKV